MKAEAANTYDEISYPTYSRATTHPDRLATLATLYGMRPAPVEKCRVLELGGGDGANLIPMAYGLPQSEFVGLELSGRAVARGQEMVAALGLSNVTLRQADIMEAAPGLGQFDYIIAHGFYSWVDAPQRDRILALCAGHLAPQGVAFISYHVYPGGHIRQMAREMMLYRIRDVAGPRAQIRAARELIEFLAGAPEEPEAYHLLLQKEAERLRGYRAGHVYHDDLEQVNFPVHFHEFVAHAAQHGLQFLAEADFDEMQYSQFSPQVSGMLAQLAREQFEAKEQYLDFLKCRVFRQTLLCHHNVPLDRELKPELMRGFRIASPAKPESPAPDINSTKAERFVLPSETAMTTDHPLAKAVMLTLSEAWPRTLAFPDLLAAARLQLGRAAETETTDINQDALVLGSMLLRAYGAEFVELRLREPQFTTHVSERPVASPVARWQAARDDVVTNLRHASIKLDDPLDRQLLLLLDGTRDRAALRRELEAWAESADARADDRETTGVRAEAPPAIPDNLEQKLEELAGLALLIA